MQYGIIKQQISNHPAITATRKVDTEILFLRDEIRLLCRVYYVDEQGAEIQSIEPRMFETSTKDSWVHPQTGAVAIRDDEGNPVDGSVLQIDYLVNIPSTLNNSTTTYGNIVIVAQGLVDSLDQRGFFNT